MGPDNFWKKGQFDDENGRDSLLTVLRHITSVTMQIATTS
jgi:hypothetical protein